MKNIILIGMPAVGKSTIGSAIARKLGMKYIDTDDVIRKSCMATLPEIIEKHGSDKFLLIEDRILSQIETTKTVISTGGSAIYGENAMRKLKEGGIVLYLKISFEEISKRLKRMKSRGVVIREGQTLKDLYDERCALCEKYADVTVDMTDFTPTVGVEQCLIALKRAGAVR
jgi:shikimate kinase